MYWFSACRIGHFTKTNKSKYYIYITTKNKFNTVSVSQFFSYIANKSSIAYLNWPLDETVNLSATGESLALFL
jgi:hypothetical protein